MSRSRKQQEFTIPGTLGGDWHPYRLKLSFRFKRMEEGGFFKGEPFEAGDYIGLANDGGTLHLTEEELNRYYKPGA